MELTKSTHSLEPCLRDRRSPLRPPSLAAAVAAGAGTRTALGGTPLGGALKRTAGAHLLLELHQMELEDVLLEDHLLELHQMEHFQIQKNLHLDQVLTPLAPLATAATLCFSSRRSHDQLEDLRHETRPAQILAMCWSCATTCLSTTKFTSAGGDPSTVFAGG